MTVAKHSRMSPKEQSAYVGINDNRYKALREELFRLRDDWDDEQTIFGQQYWEQWRRYENAALHGVGKPKGSNMANQIKDWGTDKK